MWYSQVILLSHFKQFFVTYQKTFIKSFLCNQFFIKLHHKKLGICQTIYQRRLFLRPLKLKTLRLFQTGYFYQYPEVWETYTLVTNCQNLGRNDDVNPLISNLKKSLLLIYQDCRRDSIVSPIAYFYLAPLRDIHRICVIWSWEQYNCETRWVLYIHRTIYSTFIFII